MNPLLAMYLAGFISGGLIIGVIGFMLGYLARGSEEDQEIYKRK